MGLPIQSKEVIDKISEELKVQPALEIPRELMDKIQLVYGVNPPIKTQVKEVVVSDASTGTFHTTHATKRTFIIGAQISTAKSVASTSIFSKVVIIPAEGVASALLTLRYEPITAASNLSTSIILPHPIELAKSTIIALTNSTAIASIDTAGSIYFYEVDPL